LIVFTRTGAGKSIIIGAVETILEGGQTLPIGQELMANISQLYDLNLSARKSPSWKKKSCSMILSGSTQMANPQQRTEYSGEWAKRQPALLEEIGQFRGINVQTFIPAAASQHLVARSFF
jgi:hypothetical protein